MNTKTITPFGKSELFNIIKTMNISSIKCTDEQSLKINNKIDGINICHFLINESESIEKLTKKDFIANKQTTKGVRNGDVRNPRLRTLINKLLTVKF